MIPQYIRNAVSDKSNFPMNYEDCTFSVVDTFTAAMINAGTAIIIANIPGNPRIRAISFNLIIGATAVTGLTTLRLSDLAATPNDFLTFAVADLTANANVSMGNPGAGGTRNLVNLEAGSRFGYQLRGVGSAAAGGPVTIFCSFDLKNQ